MTPPATGRAGGRGAARGPGRTAARSTVRALLAGLLTTPLIALAPAAAAAPGDHASAGEQRPVRIDVSRLEPRTLTPGAVVTVTGRLTNTGTETLTDLDVRLQRGEILETRAELVALDEETDPPTAVATPFVEVPGDLAPGDSLSFSVTSSTDELGIDRDGVYPVLLNLNGTDADGERRRVGELSTYLVQPVEQPAAPPAVGWLWPLVERTHRDAAGRFVDDDLAEEVAADGRLDRALAAVERVPATTPPEGGDPVPVARVTLAVDPALVEELELMADGGYDLAGTDATGEPSKDAAAFLGRMRAVAADHPVLALPYGDVDADALAAAGLSDVLTRSLPGTPAGTARDGAGDEVAAPASEPPPAPAEKADETTGEGARILREALGVTPRTDLAWAVGGTVRTDTRATLRAGGVEHLVVGPGGLTDGTEALGLGSGGAAARAPVPAGDGALDVLVADSGLGRLADSSVDGGPRVGEQRYLAELALLGLRSAGDPGAGQSVLVAPPREVDADPTAVSSMIAATAQLPWLRAASVEQLATGPAAAAGELLDPREPGGLEAAGLGDVVAAVRIRDDLAGAVVGDPDAALAPYDAAASRATSAAWRDQPEGFAAAAGDLRATLGRLRGQVTLLAPADGTYSLASDDAPLVLTVRNDLPFAVRVLLEVRTRGNAALSVADIGPQVLAPDQRTTLQVPTELRQSGRFGVVATLTTPDGDPLGEPVELQVNSTAYGSISLVITIGAAALLGLLFLRRLVLFLVRRRRGTPADEAAELPEGAASLPPTRSPV
ncbi:DUF6049 family protein [Geodermatophilus ruber]|uniref:Glycoprotein n=1 Tax=Geodermatophilus ruber TaxID=504800 RepID=A0A1I4J6S9_9ACTN|nr:DUF6049 family protein [Geodermatophilus ruber]SFL61931.1 hypothetical protein SAMN04488085_11465 [Geodermatophilus ruber]